MIGVEGMMEDGDGGMVELHPELESYWDSFLSKVGMIVGFPLHLIMSHSHTVVVGKCSLVFVTTNYFRSKKEKTW